jgi:hypothetical protein
MTEVPPTLHRFLRKLGHLINITRIIDRNTDDVSFAEEGEIVYIFDTNVVQMFLQPFRNPHYAELFHASILAVQGSSDALDQEINEQSCLLTAEYLVSGNLPGQKDGKWHMTRRHWEETVVQQEYLADAIRQTAARIDRDPTFKRFAVQQRGELKGILKLDPDADRQRILALAEQLGVSPARMRRLSEVPRDEFHELAAGIRSRAVCRILARDRILEPANQLNRFNNGIVQRFDDVGSILDLPAEARTEIERDADDWRKNLTKIILTRGHGIRSRDAITADCHALALIDWASRQPWASQRRVVFVTGDQAILETYRQRYVQRDTYWPFLVRPVSHFAPLFNPTSADSSLTEQKLAFDRLLQALEGAMAALNLVLLKERPNEYRLRARDHFALSSQFALQDLASTLVGYFPRFRDEVWINEQDMNLDQLVRELRPIEQLMLEAYPQFVAARLDRERLGFEAENENSAVRKSLQDRILDGLNSAIRASYLFHQPMMQAVVEELVADEQGSERALIATRVSFSDDPASHKDFKSELEHLRGAPPAELRTLVRGLSTKVFTFAALRALQLELWGTAARYADLAAKASEDRMHGASQDESMLWDDHYEHLYIEACALRFRLASTRPEPGGSLSDRWYDWLQNADRNLKRCVDHHVQQGQVVRELRALSEQASLHVSYCEWLAFGNPPVKALEAAERRILNSFRKVTENLARCAAIYDSAAERGEADPAAGTILEQITKQFRFNVFAAKLVALRLAHLFPAAAATVAKAEQILPPLQLVPWQQIPPIAEAYVAAASGDLETLKRIDASKLTLALDTAIIEGLKCMLAQKAADRATVH